MDEVWKRDEIASPCVKVCLIHEDSGLCMGCYRTRKEIAGWNKLSSDDRNTLIKQLDTRANQVKGRRRGGRLRKG